MKTVISIMLILSLCLVEANLECMPNSSINIFNSPLKIEIIPFERNLLQNEPAIFKVVLSNIGKSAIVVPGTLTPDFYQLSFSIWNSRGEKVGYQPRSVQDVFYPPDYRGITIEPNGKFTVWLDLTWQSTSDLLTKPETFTLQAHYEWNNKDVLKVTKISADSPKISITVNPPQGFDLQAFQHLEKAKNLKFNDFDTREKSFREIMRRYPNSRYTKYAHVQLAETLESRSLVLQDRGYHFKAINEWLNVVNEHKKFGFTDYAKERRAWLFGHNGDKKSSLELYHKLLLDPTFPDSRKWEITFNVRALERGSRL